MIQNDACLYNILIFITILGITVNCCHPGAVRTAIYQKLSIGWRVILTVVSFLFFKVLTKEMIKHINCVSINIGVFSVSVRTFST